MEHDHQPHLFWSAPSCSKMSLGVDIPSPDNRDTMFDVTVDSTKTRRPKRGNADAPPHIINNIIRIRIVVGRRYGTSTVPYHTARRHLLASLVVPHLFTAHGELQTEGDIRRVPDTTKDEDDLTIAIGNVSCCSHQNVYISQSWPIVYSLDYRFCHGIPHYGAFLDQDLCQRSGA